MLGMLAIGSVTIQRLPAHDLSLASSASPESVAFARYAASLERRDPFSESGPVALLIQASAHDIYKESAMLAVRQNGDDERSSPRQPLKMSCGRVRHLGPASLCFP